MRNDHRAQYALRVSCTRKPLFRCHQVLSGCSFLHLQSYNDPRPQTLQASQRRQVWRGSCDGRHAKSSRTRWHPQRRPLNSAPSSLYALDYCCHCADCSMEQLPSCHLNSSSMRATRVACHEYSALALLQCFFSDPSRHLSLRHCPNCINS